ncbi:hypothetical protein HAX54_049812, partial [Datura stramonium]|nr:hypothetical protein [Datura stramonium]
MGAIGYRETVAARLLPWYETLGNEKESSHWIHHGGVLTAIAGLLQQKCDNYSGRWKAVSG